MVSMELILEVICVALVLLWWGHRRPDNFPPGPTGFPILGYGPLLKKLPYLTAAKLGEKFGDVYSLNLGVGRLCVILSDWKSTKEALVEQSDVFSGRPQHFLIKKLFHGSDIVFIQGGYWKEKRRFAIQHLRNMGFGKASMESVITEELQQVLDSLDAKIGQKVFVADLLFLPILNIIWGLIAGRKYAMDDEKMFKFISTLKNIFEGMHKCIPFNALPILRFLPIQLAKDYQTLINANQELERFLEVELREHVVTYKEGIQRDFIDIYLAEIYKHQVQGKSSRAFQDDQLIGAMKDFFGAGVDTIMSTLSWAFLYMALWPEIQEKVHHELDRVIGRGRSPVYSDKALLPYTEAVLLETHRYASIVPFSVPHQTHKTTQLMGYTIPKDTFVLQNIWAVHHDPRYWKEPETFRPERYINDKGAIQRPEYLIPFSTGARMCLGEPLARMELFLFFTCILQRYSLHCVTGEKLPSLEPVPGITLKPQPFALIFRRRLSM